MRDCSEELTVDHLKPKMSVVFHDDSERRLLDRLAEIEAEGASTRLISRCPGLIKTLGGVVLEQPAQV